jgi:hypothetical protein
VIHLNAAFSQELDHVPVGQAVAQVPNARPQGSPQAGSGTPRTPTEQR